MASDLRVLYVTSEWPTAENPHWVPFLKQEVEHLRQNDISVVVHSFRGRKNPYNYFLNWVKLHREYHFDQFDLIHAQFGQSGLVVLPVSLPLVVTFHGSDLQGWIGRNGKFSLAGKIMQRLSRFTARHADQVIIVSEHLASNLPSNINIHVIPCGIDLELFQPLPKEQARQILNLPTEKDLILFPADPGNPIKRFSLAQEAFERLRSKFDLELIALKDVPHKQVPLYMNACDVLLLTSKHEGAPIVVKEALACNLPIVSVDVGDVKHWISGIEGCALCPDDNPITISSAISQVLSSQQRINSRPLVLLLSWNKTVRRVIDVYQAALNG